MLRLRDWCVNHDDEIAGHYLDMASYPLFMAIRDEIPGVRFIDPLYPVPMSFNTVTKQYMASGGVLTAR